VKLVTRQTVEMGMFVRETVGPAFEPPLLFIHGLGESGLCFECLFQMWGKSLHHMLVPDLPGYGRSAWSREEALGLTDHADLLAAWLRERRLPPVVAVGHSMGGVVALLLAERHPELLAGVVDVDGNKSPGDCVFSSQAARWGYQEFCHEGFGELQEAIHDKGATDRAQRGYYVSMRLADPRAYFRNSLELVRMSETRDMAIRLSQLPLPRLYIAGVPGGCCDETHQLLADAEVPKVDVRQSGHWPFIDNPQEFGRALLKFVRMVGSGPENRDGG
jgi:pimeloyl-ACP methyl ester carboxylesterase